MTDREVKEILKKAYAVAPSEREKIFLKAYEKRSRSFMAALRLEFRYMGLKNVLAGLVLCTVLLALVWVKAGDTRLKWNIASILPLFALTATELVGRSERYGMAELETASRFSLRTLRMARMLILGGISLLVLLGGGVIFRKYLQVDPVLTVGLVGIPYLLNVSGCLWLTRKWHARESIYGCAGITVIACLLPSFGEVMQTNGQVNAGMVWPLMLFLAAATVREAILYMKDGEDVVWNLG